MGCPGGGRARLTTPSQRLGGLSPGPLGLRCVRAEHWEIRRVP
jgi:hypothetical protein